MPSHTIVRSFRFWLLVALVPAVSGACVAPSTDSSTSFQTSEEAHIVAKDVANAAEVLPDRLIFPASYIPEDLRRRIREFEAAMAQGIDREDVENVILMADRQDGCIGSDGTIPEHCSNPFGFIRRALSYELDGDAIVIMTESASLAEAFVELEQNGVLELGSEPAPDSPGAGPLAQGHIDAPTIPLIDISGMEIYRKGDDYVRLSSAFITLQPSLDVGVSIKWAQLQQAHVIIDADVQAELVVESQMAVTPGIPISKEVFVAKYPLPPLGSLPMTLGLRLVVGCKVGVGGFHIEGGAHSDLSFTGGFNYTREGGVEPVGDVTVDAHTIGPSFEVLDTKAAQFKCYVQPRLEVLFFDVVGPMVKTDAYGLFTFTSPPAHLLVEAGLSGHLGGTMRIFTFKLPDLAFELFDRRHEVWQGP